MKSARPESSNAPGLYPAAALMAVSMSVAVYLSLQPERLSDLYRVASWGGEWLRGGHVYNAAIESDYPPWAIVPLSWLSLIPRAWLGPAWVSINALMLAGSAWLIARRFGAQARPTKRTNRIGSYFEITPDPIFVLTFLLIAAGAGRTLNQFSLPAFAFGALGLCSRGWWSGIWLGLACMKPQIGGVFVIASMLERRWRDLLVAAAVPVALTVVYTVVAHVAFLQVLADYWTAARSEQGGVVPGRTEIAPAVAAFLPWIGGLGAAALVAVLAALPLARPSLRDPSRGGFWLVVALVSLLSMRHLSYDFILFLPWLATLEGAPLWIAASLLVANPSAVIGVVAPMSLAATYADRAVLVLMWLGTLRAAIKPRGETLR